MNIINAVDDPQVFGAHFRSATWDAWRVFLKALFALPISDDELALYYECTGRSAPPRAPSNEAWLVIGRRGGKSFVLAVIAVFAACFKDWRPYLGPGEVATIMVVCADRRQARVIMRYALGLLNAVPMLKRQIENVTRESISLKNRVVIEIHAANFRTTRGYAIPVALLDELAYLPTDEASAQPDAEIINAIRPAQATIPGALMLCASSPHARRGALWDAYRKHYAKDDDPVLVWQAPTRTMNPSVPQSFIDAHMADDPARAAAEYLAQFRSDLEGYVLREAVESCVHYGLRERPPEPSISYVGFIDPSGGSSDSMTLAIAHTDRARHTVVLDALREVKPPFSPEAVVNEFAGLLKSYRIATVTSDRYGGAWVTDSFTRSFIRCQPSAKVKSDLYVDLLPLINGRRVELLDNAKLVNQLLGLERRTSRAGRDSIDHVLGGHDDLANALAGVAAALTADPGAAYLEFCRRFNGSTDADRDGVEAWRRLRDFTYVSTGGAVKLW